MRGHEWRPCEDVRHWGRGPGTPLPSQTKTKTPERERDPIIEEDSDESRELYP
jgi:hypothetical protein